MKYFTDGLTDEQWLANQAAYRARIEEIMPQLSPELRKLATYDINLHDGLIRGITLDRTARNLTVSLRCGDHQNGYFDVDLAYSDLEIELLDLKMLKALATDPKTELIYSEIDLGPPGRFVHRILFWSKPMCEIEVVFGSLKVSTEPRPDRERGKSKGLFSVK